MQISSVRDTLRELREMGIENVADVHYQLSPEELTAQTLQRSEGCLNSSGALVVNTGEFTGRSRRTSSS